VTSACAHDTAGDRIRWDGCYRRRTTTDADPSASYTADESDASGEGSFWNSLLMGRTDHRYGAGKQIVQGRPTADRPDTDCTTITLAGTYYGVSLSVPFQACFGFYDVIDATPRTSNEWRDVFPTASRTGSVEAVRASSTSPWQGKNCAPFRHSGGQNSHWPRSTEDRSTERRRP
jgi:hypothetical protein